MPHISQVCFLLFTCICLMCFFRFSLLDKTRLHVLHLYSPSSCLLTCLLRSESWVNSFPHVSHLFGLMPSWIIMWVFRYCFTLNRFLHFSHSNGRSPVWMRLCLFRSWGKLNPFSHFEHWYFLSCELWLLSCCLKCFLTRTLLHILHSRLVCSFKGISASFSTFKCRSKYEANSDFKSWFFKSAGSMVAFLVWTTTISFLSIFPDNVLAPRWSTVNWNISPRTRHLIHFQTNI